MDFFGQQERARVASRRLVMLFLLAVVAIIGCIYAAATTLLVVADQGSAWQPEVLLLSALGTVAVVGGASAWKTAQLRGGGSIVAAELGGRRIAPETQDADERRLRNLVEEMAIAAGVPVPELFVLDQEDGINAFAAGWGPTDAAIAVTRGCLQHLDRDELQGVIAHEFSHVFHGDMRLNIRLMGVLFGILCLAVLGRVLLHTGGRSGGGRNRGNQGAGLVVFGLALLVIGYLGVFFARMIQAAVSRQREFLADASAVQYTRNPRGIGMALAKIGGFGGALRNAHAEEASHMLFADGVQRQFGGALATHPPLRERIRRLLPGLQLGKAADIDLVAAVAKVEHANIAGLAAPVQARAPGTAAIRGAELLASVGEPAAHNLDASAALLAGLPVAAREAAHSAVDAPALVLGMLLDRQTARQQQQLAPILARDATLAAAAARLHSLLSGCAASSRLPLLELALPALRSLPAVQRAQLRNDARALAYADGELSAFEFALLKTLERHLPRPGELPPRPTGRPLALLDAAPAAATLLAALARVGADGDETAAALAFNAGWRQLAELAPRSLPAASDANLAALDEAMQQLSKLSPLGKKQLLAAAVQAANADGQLTTAEADLLRALAEFWDCPIPLPAPKNHR